MDVESLEDAEAYVLRSKYRSNALEGLATGGQATPTELADDTGDPRPHVSRALSELREVGIVDLRVPEVRNVGRYYDLTELGEAVWRNVEEVVRGIDWSIEEPAEGALRTVVELAKEEFGEALRTVGTHDCGQVTFLYAKSGVLESHPGDSPEQLLRTLIYDHPLTRVELSNRDHKSETLHLDDFVILRIHASDDLRVFVSFEETRNVSIPAFSERILAIVDPGSDAGW